MMDDSWWMVVCPVLTFFKGKSQLKNGESGGKDYQPSSIIYHP